MEDFTHVGKPNTTKRDWSSYLIFGIFLFLIGMTLALVMISLVVPKVINSTVEAYTDVAPLVMPAPDVEYTEEFKEEVEERIDTFKQALLREDLVTVENDDTVVAPVSELVLSEDELNSLLFDDESLRDSVYLAFKDGQLRTHLSIPLESDVSLGPWNATMNGRYINGVAVMDVGFDTNGLKVSLVEFKVKGNPVPEWVLSLLQTEIEKEGFLKSDDVQEIMAELENVQILGNELILTPKSR